MKRKALSGVEMTADWKTLRFLRLKAGGILPSGDKWAPSQSSVLQESASEGNLAAPTAKDSATCAEIEGSDERPTGLIKNVDRSSIHVASERLTVELDGSSMTGVSAPCMSGCQGRCARKPAP